MSRLGYQVDRDIDDQYQQYHGAPVQDTIMSFFVSALMAIALMMAVLVCGFWAWGKVFRDKKPTSYTGGDKEMVYLRDQQ